MQLARRAIRGVAAELAEFKAEHREDRLQSAFGTKASHEEVAALHELADALGQPVGELVRWAVARLIHDVTAMTDEPKAAGNGTAASPPPRRMGWRSAGESVSWRGGCSSAA